MKPVCIIGAGLAGSEAAWQLASRGVPVRLVEMRPLKMTPAHTGGEFGELVCSNSLGADVLSSPAGILKSELRKLGSLVMRAADHSSVPAGRALAVDRERFAGEITKVLEEHPLVEIVREERSEIPSGPCIIATGPLTSGPMAESLRVLTGEEFLHFFDAVAPVLTRESVDMGKAYKGSRYGQGEDYINCPLDEAEYDALVEGLVTAERAMKHEFERKQPYFEGCLPVEILAMRGRDTLRFGPLRPVGLPDPRSGREPFAVVQLRQDNLEGTLFNMVGFQTNLKWKEQERVFRLIPALREADFVRLGVMHRNLYVNAPRVLDKALRPAGRQDLFLAGQIVGVEGYMESTAMGVVAATGLESFLNAKPFPVWPRESAIGSLLHYLSDALPETFQPMNVNLGIFPPLENRIRSRTDRCQAVAARAARAFDVFLEGWAV
ncbi:MAG: methylenetetrahydrofolate--tRNA-(uracil(54)-C(5))-methyltransferase (FADH(2)-oxidizing) TrmFO [Synergistales bacterium]